MDNERIPLPPTAAQRLPVYFRAVREMLMEDVFRANSVQIAAKTGFLPSQVRSDLHFFGLKGQKGYGYNVKTVYTEISTALGAGDGFRAIYLGETGREQVLADEGLFLSRGIALEAVFARNCPCQPDVLPMESLAAYLEKLPVPQIAVFGPGFRGAKEAAACLVSHGVKGILNLSDTELVSIGCPVESFNPGDALMRLCYSVRGTEG